jgi:hypothetical protein
VNPHLVLAFLEKFERFLVKKRAFPLDDPPEEEIAPEEIDSDRERSDKPDEGQDSQECRRPVLILALPDGLRSGNGNHLFLTGDSGLRSRDLFGSGRTGIQGRPGGRVFSAGVNRRLLLDLPRFLREEMEEVDLARQPAGQEQPDHENQPEGVTPTRAQFSAQNLLGSQDEADNDASGQGCLEKPDKKRLKIGHEAFHAQSSLFFSRIS